MRLASLAPFPGPHHLHPAKFVHEAATPNQMETLGDFSYMPVRFLALGPERPEIHIHGVSKGYLNIWRTRAENGFQTLSKGPLDVMSLRVLRQGRMLRRNVRGDYTLGPGQALLLPFDAMRDLRSAAEFDAISCSFPRTTLEHLRAEIEEKPSGPLAFEPLVELRTPALRIFVRMLERAFELISSNHRHADLMFPLVEEIILGQLLTVWPRRPMTDEPVVENPSKRQVGRALDYIDGNLARPIYVTEVARAIGVNVRSLQKGFREHLGRTMVQHIIMRRLERAREDLLAMDGKQVSEIAYRWGFTHLSDFTRRYQAQYGEAPSKTARPESRWSKPMA